MNRNSVYVVQETHDPPDTPTAAGTQRPASKGRRALKGKIEMAMKSPGRRANEESGREGHA